MSENQMRTNMLTNTINMWRKIMIVERDRAYSKENNFFSLENQKMKRLKNFPLSKNVYVKMAFKWEVTSSAFSRSKRMGAGTFCFGASVCVCVWACITNQLFIGGRVDNALGRVYMWCSHYTLAKRPTETADFVLLGLPTHMITLCHQSIVILQYSAALLASLMNPSAFCPGFCY